MRELLFSYSLKANYYALLLAITKNETASEALSEMGIITYETKKEEGEEYV